MASMIKVVTGVTGVMVFISSFILGNSLRTDEKLATSLDDEETSYGIVGEGPPLCSWTVNLPERVMVENKSQAIVVETTNTSEEACESTVSLRAPGFDMSPVKEEQKIVLAVGEKGSLSWILTPRKTGTFEIAVSDALNTRIYGITVKNVFGLTTTQAKSFSIAGSLFGPMFTVPWWVEKWWFRRKRRHDNQRDVNDTDN